NTIPSRRRIRSLSPVASPKHRGPRRPKANRRHEAGGQLGVGWGFPRPKRSRRLLRGAERAARGLAGGLTGGLAERATRGLTGSLAGGLAEGAALRLAFGLGRGVSRRRDQRRTRRPRRVLRHVDGSRLRLHEPFGRQDGADRVLAARRHVERIADN